MLEGVTESDFAGIRNLKYCGALKPGDVVSTIEKYDAFLFPSFYDGEGYPGVILEAYMAGVPVITTDWISIPEIVEDGKSGIIIEPKNPQQLAEAMTELINDKEKLTALKKGVIEYRKEFSSVIWTEKFIRLVNELSSVE
jgi:glycosyltransferase involved in cell wall biosynthesis